MLHLRMPIGHNFTCGVATDNAYEGLLHMYIRHYTDFEQKIPGLTAQRLALPLMMQQKMKAISSAVNIYAVTNDVTAFMNAITSKHSRTLYKTQRMILQFLQSTVNKLYAGTSRTSTGKTCYLYNVKGVAKPLKLAPAKHLDPVNQAFEDGRRVRKIITAYF